MTQIFAKIGNITKEECTCHCGCGRFNVGDDFLVKLQAFRLKLNKPLIINCIGRCIKHNKDVGGVSTSLHQCQTKKATAADVTNSNCEEIYKEACLVGLFNEIEWHKTDGKNFVHLGCDPNQKGNSFKVI